MKCVIDCDPGHDDMVAIMLMVYSPSLSIQYISTTHGNQTVNKTYINARRTLNLIHRADKIPVYRGYASPLIREGVACPEIHGESGLGGVDWSEIDSTMPRNPALDILGYADETELKPTDFFAHLHRLISETPDNERFQIVTTASMTNIAQYLRVYPADASKMKISCMAGNFKTVGNILPFSEFNVLVDPEATDLILKSAVEMHFSAPLDVTHTVLVTPSVLSSIEAATKNLSPKFFGFIRDLLFFFTDTYKNVFGFKSPPLHDPVAVYYLLHPEQFECVKCHVDIETKGEYTYGACCSDLLMKKKKEPNAIVCLRLVNGGIEEFWKTVIGVWTDIAKEIA
ncbi:nucleoside hydrolase [Histomonas meleagridis]|uniref:nucleoside hydrolase n=1 Tax=Histomonas meleagridis TaxID=135588 RepID=UPI00355AAC15|nr:nucleoside hydrolase [Histomonas meleagridis]KAH0798605.1 nucleoside hydrolase [Histomonas meleagridis]